MALVKVTAQLLDESKRPLANIAVRIVSFTNAGRARALASGTSDRTGQVVLSAELPESTLFPRLVLQYQAGSAWRDLSETAQQQTREGLDFGKLVIAKEPNAVGSRRLFGVAEASFDAAAVRAGEANLLLATNAEGMDQLKAENSRLEGLLLAREETLRSSALELEAMTGRLAANQTQLSDLQTRLAKADSDNSVLLGSKNALSVQLEERQQRVLQLEQETAQVKHQLESKIVAYDKLNKDLGEAKVALNSAKDKLSEFNASPPLEDLVSQVGAQIGVASQNIRTASGGLRLSNVGVKLKAISTGDGTRFSFPTKSELNRIAGAEMSEIQLSFYPATEANPAASGVKVPQVLGYTELVARRKLEALGFAVDVSQKAVAVPKSGPSPVGRVVEQRPAPGAQVEAGQIVELLLGKVLGQGKEA